MFRHQGKTRTLSHNLQIASLLSFIAGLVNVAGFFSVQRLTTNVTGHFAFFVDEMFKLNFWAGWVYFLYIFFFFLGSFVSGFLLEWMLHKNERNLYVLPAFLECGVLIFLGLEGNRMIDTHPDWIAFGLLFAMGLQNSLVTSISSSSVRTTHLTGLFTDLGIELSQLFFFQEKEQQHKLRSSIQLRFTIIGSFFLGGIVGGMLYTRMHLHALLVAAGLLLLGLMYDQIKFKWILWRRKMKSGY